MKEDIIKIIKILGVGYNEIIMDITLDLITINSIEFREPNNVYLHHYDDDLDYEIEFDSISIENQKIIFKEMNSLIYN